LIKCFQRSSERIRPQRLPRRIRKESAAKPFEFCDLRAASETHFQMCGDDKRRAGAERARGVTQQALFARVTLERHT
jgi:hypothetical protein